MINTKPVRVYDESHSRYLAREVWIGGWFKIHYYRPIHKILSYMWRFEY